ncbi:MAG: hypothetical protein Q8K59_10625 [Nitrosomonas sp.]|nr:hypothetical protein [Nitrosomonas sp.]
MRLIGKITAILSLLTLSGCTLIAPIQSQPEKEVRPSAPLPPSTRPAYNLSGYPPTMKEGYIDGCETAKKTRYGQKNKHLYATDEQYRLGWDDGFDLCQGKAN